MKRYGRGLLLWAAVAGLVIGTGAAVESVAQEKKEKVAGQLTFEVYKDRAGEFRFRLLAANGENIAAASQGYRNKADAMHAIDVIQKGAAKAKVREAEEGKEKK